jgi:hypothetical protein
MRKAESLSYQSFRSSAKIRRFKDLTSSRVAAQIVEPWALICQHIPVTKKANPPKSKLFDVVACPKTGVTEFSHPLDQSGHAMCHLRLSPLVMDKRREQMFVRPLRGNVHINQEPPLRRTPSGALEGYINVIFLTAATTQSQSKQSSHSELDYKSTRINSCLGQSLASIHTTLQSS